MTLASALMAMGLSTVVAAGIGSMFWFTARGYASLDNAISLENQNRLALDMVTKEIRQAESLVAVAPGNLTFRTQQTNLVSLVYVPGQRVLVRREGASSKVVLRNCDGIEFETFKRIPSTNGNYQLVRCAAAQESKVVRIKWSCSKNTMGRASNQVDAQSAHVVMRNYTR